MRTFSCEIIAENSKFAAKKFANQNEMYFDKNLNEFKLGNSRSRTVNSRIPRNSTLGILISRLNIFSKYNQRWT